MATSGRQSWWRGPIPHWPPSWVAPSPALPGRPGLYTAAQQHWVSGTVSLDGPQLRDLIQRADGWLAARVIVMHELGHLVGLGHVSIRDQLMYEDNIGQRDFGAGDREGLRQLGLGPCFPNTRDPPCPSGRQA